MQYYGKKIFYLVGIGALSFWVAQCNTAPDGFSAPAGSKVIAPTEPATIATTTDGLVSVTFSVTMDEARIVAGNPPTQSVVTVPGNNLFIIFTCFNCTLFDRAAGESVTLPDSSRLTAVSNPYTAATDALGKYTVVLRIRAPANLGVKSYNAIISASIGVDTKQFTIAVTTPS